MVALAAITNMSLHDLKEERERLEERLIGAEAEMNLAMAEIAMAQATVTKAKERHKRAKCLMTILDDKIADMEEVRDSVLEGDEMVESVVRATHKRGWSGAQGSVSQAEKLHEPHGGWVGPLGDNNVTEHY